MNRSVYLLIFLILISLFGFPAKGQSGDRQNDSILNARLIEINQLIGRKTDSAISLLDADIEAYRSENQQFNIARTLSMKSWALVFTGRYEDGIRIGQEAFTIQQKIQDTSGTAQTLNRLGILNLQFERYRDAIGYMRRSLSIFEELRDSLNIDMVLNNIGVSYSEMNLADSALYYYQQSLSIRERISIPHWIAFQHYNIAEVYMKLENTDSAGYHYLRSENIFLNESQRKEVPAMVLQGIGRYYNAVNQTELGTNYLKRGLALAEEREHQILILEGRESLAKALYSQESYKEAYEMLDAWQDLKSELDSVNRAEKVAEMEGQFQSAQDKIAIAELETEKLKAERSAQSFKIIVIALSLSILLALLLLWVLFNRKRQKQKLKESDLHTKIAELKLQALKAQMNPHFIFNCINTTQNFVLNQQQEEAYEYLAKFARLLRLVLENSDNVFISLEEEVQMISLYLELEAIRFDNSFSFQIDLDSDLQEGVYLIPGMIIQPIVENALLHGIVNRKMAGGQISISFTLNQDRISCVVEDNGVGRAEAQRIKEKKALHYQSKALPNIKNRMAILEAQVSIPTRLEIEDLFEAERSSGTRVTVSFPFK